MDQTELDAIPNETAERGPFRAKRSRTVQKIIRSRLNTEPLRHPSRGRTKRVDRWGVRTPLAMYPYWRLRSTVRFSHWIGHRGKAHQLRLITTPDMIAVTPTG